MSAKLFIFFNSSVVKYVLDAQRTKRDTSLVYPQHTFKFRNKKNNFPLHTYLEAWNTCRDILNIVSLSKRSVTAKLDKGI